MKNMKKIFILLIVAAGLLTFSSCSNFDEMNTPATGLTASQLPPANSFARMIYRGVFYDHQRNMNLYDDLYSYYFADNTTWWSGIYYAYNDGWAGCLWTQFYTDFLQMYYLVEEACGDEASYQGMKAINDVAAVYLWSRMTDRWGSVPYTGAGLGETVAYTSQQEIYADLFSRLQNDIKVLGSVSQQYSPGEYDLIYSGNYSQWKKFAASLMLRFATRVSKVDPSASKQYAQEAISAGCFSSVDDVALLPYDASVFGDYYDRTSWDWGQTTPDVNFVSLLNGTNPGYTTGVQDPRISIFFIPARAGKYEGQYVGFPHGDYTADDIAYWSHANDGTTYTGNTYALLNEDNPDGYFYNGYHNMSRSNLAYPIMTYSEVLFCKAELALRGIISGDPEGLWKQGIEASIWEAAAHTQYCGTGKGLVSQSQIDSYINALPAFGSSNEQKLRSIMIQKWIGLYPNSTEAWNELRRTGYPDCASGLVNYPGVSASALVQDGNMIQRICYTDNSYNYDSENIPADYQAGGSKNTYRMQYGVWWSYAGDGGTYSYKTTPSNL